MIQKFLKLPSEPVKTEEKFFNSAVALGLCLLIAFWVSFAFRMIPRHPSFFESFGQVDDKPDWIDYIQMFVFGCILAPISEELIFRVAPIKILVKLGKLEELGLPVFLVTGLYWFGISWHQNGYESVFLQGSIGVILSFLYIRNGMDWKYNMLVHAVYNLMFTFIVT